MATATIVDRLVLVWAKCSDRTAVASSSAAACQVVEVVPSGQAASEGSSDQSSEGPSS